MPTSTETPESTTPRWQVGTWTLTAPDGRTWQADSPLKCCGAEQRERVPPEVAIKRIFAACYEPAAAPVRGLPLTEERIKDICSTIYASDYPGGVADLVLGCSAYDVAIVRAAERAHGIGTTAPGGDGETPR